MPLSKDTHVLTWNIVEEAARLLLDMDCGCDGPVEFAEAAWAHLIKAGLASFSTELERTRVKIRLLALFWLYWDFSYLAFDDERDLDWDEWAATVGLPNLHRGQLVGDRDDLTDRFADEGEFGGAARRALGHCLAHERAVVVAAIAEGFGEPIELFCRLWVSQRSTSQRVRDECERITEDLDDDADPATILVDPVALWEDARMEALHPTLTVGDEEDGRRMQALDWILSGSYPHYQPPCEPDDPGVFEPDEGD